MAASSPSSSTPSRRRKNKKDGILHTRTLSSRPELCGQTTALHRAVYERDYDTVQSLIQEHKASGGDDHAFLDARDARGNSPFHIAAHWGDLRLIDILADAGARLDPSDAGWAVIQEAAASGMRPAMERLYVLGMTQARNMLRARSNLASEELARIPDFYLEINWSFSTWVPLISRFFPSDTYRVWKIGSAVRVDTTLVGFENNRFKVGNNSLLFTGAQHPVAPNQCVILNRVEKTAAYIEDNINPDDEKAREVAVSTLLNGKRSLSSRRIIGEIHFVPSQGWFGGEKQDVVSGWQTKKYHSVGLTYRHLKRREPAVRSSGAPRTVKDLSTAPKSQDYFGQPPLPFELGKGLLWPSEVEINETKSYEANIWITQEFPLTVLQLLPLFRAMTPLSEQFTRLEEFITLNFPEGFPVKFELPGLYFIITASVTFSNYKPINAANPTETGVEIPQGLFDIPEDFSRCSSLLADAVGEALEYEGAIRSEGVQM